MKFAYAQACLACRDSEDRTIRSAKLLGQPKIRMPEINKFSGATAADGNLAGGLGAVKRVVFHIKVAPSSRPRLYELLWL